MPRKVIVGFGISLDGYIARLYGDLDFLVIDKEGESLVADFFSRLMPRSWAVKPRLPWRKCARVERFPRRRGVANCVVSRRWKPGKREGFAVVGGSRKTLVRKLKRRPGKDIYLAGGAELARSFPQQDLVDELFIGLGPLLLGDSVPGVPASFRSASSS